MIESIVNEICKTPDNILVPGKNSTKAVTYKQFIVGVLNSNSADTAAKNIGISRSSVLKYFKILFPEKVLGRLTLKGKLLLNTTYKYCSTCDTIKKKSEFRADKHQLDRLDSRCMICAVSRSRTAYKINPEAKLQSVARWRKHNPKAVLAQNANRRAKKLNATPKWADLDKIKEIYENCPQGFHVDHIVPLNGKNVCGLHVENNLQYLSADENLKKSNKFDDMDLR